MSYDQPIDDPLPTVPLEYFQQSNGSWILVSRWATWVAFAYAAIAIAGDLPAVIYYFLPNFGTRRITVVTMQTLVLMLPRMVSAVLLLCSSLMLLKNVRAGRPLLIGACAALIASWLIYFIVSLFQYLIASNYRQFGPAFPIYQCVYQFFGLLRSSFFPVVLILLFCKREVKESI